MTIVIKTLPFVKTKSFYYFSENIVEMSCFNYVNECEY